MNLRRIIILVLLTLLLAVVVFFEPLGIIDNVFYDINFLLSAKPAFDWAVLVAIDVKSISELGSMPWSRDRIARLIRAIESCRPRVIALDMLLPPRPEDPESDTLAAVLEGVRNLVLPFRVGGITSRQPRMAPSVPEHVRRQRFHHLHRRDQLDRTPFYSVTQTGASDPVFCRRARFGGFLNISTRGASRKVREVIHVIRIGNNYYPSFGLSAVAAYYRLKQNRFILDGNPRVFFDRRRIVPLTPYAGTSFINFRSNQIPIPSYSASDLLFGNLDPAKLKDRLVFVGVTDPAAGADFFSTPVRSQFPGVEIWANAALDILEKSWIVRGGGRIGIINILLVFLLVPGLAVLALWAPRSFCVAAGVVVVMCSMLVSSILFRTSNYFWGPANHLLAGLICLVWVAFLKGNEVVEELQQVQVDPPDQESHDTPPPPKPEDLLKEIPATTTALHAFRKVVPEGYAMTLTDPDGKVALKRESDNEVLTQQPDEVLSDFRNLVGGEIVRVLGRGGMADVYLTWNPRLEMYRAVKVMKPGQPKELLQRFETEIRIFSKLNHPNIVQCHGADDWHGLPCVEMEYTDGVSMEKVLEKLHAVPPMHAVAVCIFLCRALSYAHNQTVTIYGETYKGIIHRDLKPANILLSRQGMVKLTDFGIARPERESLDYTQIGTIPGTLPYVAPEEIHGQPMTFKADIYALGTILYEFLTGRKAFPQADALRLVKAKATNKIKPLRRSRNLPRNLIDTVYRAMAQDPKDRFATAADMSKELEVCLRILLKGKPYPFLKALADEYWSKYATDTDLFKV